MAATRAGGAPRETRALAVRYLLQVLTDVAPGHTVEVRVPPFGAVQAVEGPRHTRGTPPNVVEADAVTFVALATGDQPWDEAVADGRVTASGSRADLRPWLPLPWTTMEA
ncbi:MAG: sterol carrier family protein [Schumannella sp.]